MPNPILPRRDFLRSATAVGAAAGASLSGLNAALAAGLSTSLNATNDPADTKHPKLSLIARYSPQTLKFAASAGYEGVVLRVDADTPDLDLTDSQIDGISKTAREVGIGIVSLDCLLGYNHIAQDAGERKLARSRFLRSLELAHRLGCKFVGMFSGGISGASDDTQVKEYAAVINETYLPACEKLDLRIGHENYPSDINFATVPALWEKLLTLVPNRRYGLEFDPSHLVRQFIDPVQTAWDFRDRILAVHAKDTELIQLVLQKVGIHGKGWWRYRIPGQGLIDWPKFITVLLQAGFRGGFAVEHEDDFWDEKPADEIPSTGIELPQARKTGFILAARFLRQYLPGRLD
jgi:sugar phosphate isomerase/epimerase